MRFQFYFDKVEGDGEVKARVIKRFSALEKYLRHVSEEFRLISVKIERGDRWGYNLKIEIKLPGKMINTTGNGKTLLSAIDEGYANTARVIRKYMERLQEKPIRI